MQTHIIDAIQWDRVWEIKIDNVREKEDKETRWVHVTCMCVCGCEWRVRWSMQSFIVLNQYTLYMDSQSIPQYFYNFLFLHKIKRRHALYTEYCMRQNFRNKNLLSIVYGYCCMQMVIDDPPFAIIWYMVDN